MEKMHTSILSAYLLAFIVSFPTAVFAVANGRNCNNPVFISYENAILTGSVEDVKIEADHVIDYEIERIKKDSGGYFLQGDRPDRKKLLRKLISTGIGYCTTGSEALSIAALAGNIDVTQWLLDNGADPSAPNPSMNPNFPSDNIFSRCSDWPIRWRYSYPFEDESIRGRRVKAYRILISTGGRPDMLLNSTFGAEHRDAMHLCKDTSLLELFIKSGARLRQSHLDLAISDLLSYSPNTDVTKLKNDFERVKLFISNGVEPRRFDLERISKPGCNIVSRESDSPEPCTKLRALINTRY